MIFTPGLRSTRVDALIALVVWLTAVAGGASEAAEGTGHDPFRPDGSWRYTNRLVESTSPYLQLHAHNPVDWYPWGEEAFALARDLDRPIFLSVGYSTCYWCHVMERKVFSDPEIAATMNAHFVNIKVDREERPDLDRIYMAATQLSTGHGGWPNSVFLTPELKPFFAGTYFPPEDVPGRPGFPRVLETLQLAWVERRDEVEQVARRMVLEIGRIEAGARVPQPPAMAWIDSAIGGLKRRYDGTHGGFGGAPKFPPVMRLQLLVDAWERNGDGEARRIVEHTLSAMALGGIHDHVGGGFHRYATDAQWRVPHFEKMLYNQAQLIRLYARVHRLTGNERWRGVIEATLQYVAREMTATNGAYFSALDAESEAIEGKYYTWTRQQLVDVLGGEECETLLKVYGLEHVPEGAGEVLYQRTPLAETATAMGRSLERLQRQLKASLERLRQKRRSRAYPLLDDKIITSWNGMLIAAIAEAGVALGNDAVVEAAAGAARAVLNHLRTDDDRLLRIYRDGEASQPGFLEDYAHLSEGLLSLHRATNNKEWLDEARRVMDVALADLWNEQGGGGFHFAPPSRHLIARSTTGHDMALPSANAVAAHALIELSLQTGEEKYREKAEALLTVFGGNVARAPSGHSELIRAAWRLLTLDEEGRLTALQVNREALSDFYEDLTPVPRNETVNVVNVSLGEPRRERGDHYTIDVRLSIAEGWHVNANSASADLIPTSVTVNSPDLDVTVEGIDYPPAEALFFSALQESLAVYEGVTEIPVRLRVGPATEGDRVNLLIQYQACDDSRCLAPEEAMHTVTW
ncbi:MAG: DUF255 domain-containing protein [Candidatus Latescibacterota bacterium]|nr:DUF255 domain-containing protein [Candidatus Latescibacterota bacterium]